MADTVRSFREILDGKHDDLPESAFYMKGSIDQVRDSTSEKGEKDEGVERERPRPRSATRIRSARTPRRRRGGSASPRRRRRAMADDHKLEAQVLTPEGAVFEGELFQLSTRTPVGEVGDPRPATRR